MNPTPDENTPDPVPPPKPVPAADAEPILTTQSSAESFPQPIDEPQAAQSQDEPAPQPKREKLDAFEPNPHAEMSFNPSSKIDEKQRAKFKEDERLALLAVPVDVFNEIIEQLPQLDIANSEAGQEYLSLIGEARIHLLTGNPFKSSVAQGLWRQSVRNGGEEIRGGRPRLLDNNDPTAHLTGERAVIKISSVLGLGAVVQIPLWHTGVWVSIKAPTESELLELDRRTGMEKIKLGRHLNGLIFSNASIYTNTYLVNLALSKVYDASVKDISMQALKNIIKLPDMTTLIWGLACAIWPNGYPYKQPCTANPAACNAVMEEMISLAKLSWTNNRALTEQQVKHMSNRNAKFTTEQLQRYQDEFKFNKYRTFSLHHDAMTVELKVPTIDDYETSGYDWVDSIVRNTDQAFGTTMSEEERNAFIVNQGKSTSMRQYSHWVERLVLSDEGGIVTDRASLEQSIATLSVDSDIEKEFFDSVAKFIDETCVSLIAMPRYECPECHKDSHAESKAHPHLVPLDVARVFFTLLTHRCTKVRSKSLT